VTIVERNDLKKPFASIAFLLVVSLFILSACGSAKRSASAFCNVQRELGQDSFIRLSSKASKAQVKSATEQFLSDVHKAANVAPNEIKDDMAAVSSALDQLAEVIKSSGYKLSSSEVTAAQKKLGENQTLQQASKSITQFETTRCSSTTTS
jgi:hypothetical protein